MHKQIKNEEMKKILEKMQNLILEVVEIYEESDGTPVKCKDVECPECGRFSNNYTCAWDMNKHVHFSCPHCDFFLMQ